MTKYRNLIPPIGMTPGPGEFQQVKPRRVYEETWTHFDADPPGLAIDGQRFADFDTVERARLAAQAPGMARELVKALERMRHHNATMGPYERPWPTPEAQRVIDLLTAAGVPLEAHL